MRIKLIFHTLSHNIITHIHEIVVYPNIIKYVISFSLITLTFHVICDQIFTHRLISLVMLEISYIIIINTTFLLSRGKVVEPSLNYCINYCM